MEDNKSIVPEEYSFLSEQEYSTYREGIENGFKPISPSLQSQMFELFLDGYDCKEIAKQNPGFNEKDIMVCRVKHGWDSERDIYAFKLRNMVQQRLQQAKLESIEFITNILAVHHKSVKDQMLKYIQTGNPEHLPEQWIKNPNSYKNVIEILQKLTGEDKVSKQQIHSTSEIIISDKSAKDAKSIDKKTILRKAAEKLRGKNEQ